MDNLEMRSGGVQSLTLATHLVVGPGWSRALPDAEVCIVMLCKARGWGGGVFQSEETLGPWGLRSLGVEWGKVRGG
jgi:hypothetical protein